MDVTPKAALMVRGLSARVTYALTEQLVDTRNPLPGAVQHLDLGKIWEKIRPIFFPLFPFLAQKCNVRI